MGLKSSLFKILELQRHYSFQQSPPMDERRKLLKEVESEIRQTLLVFNDLVGLKVQSKSSTGYNSIIPWVRIYDHAISPKPTFGWYVVLLFPATGNEVFLSLNQGTNSLSDSGDLKREPLDLIEKRANEARGYLHNSNSIPTGSVAKINLKAPRSARGLAEGYERGNVCAFVLTEDIEDFDSYLIRCIQELEKCRQLFDLKPVTLFPGGPYKTAIIPKQSMGEASQPFFKDPAKLERATKAHAETQNKLAEIIIRQGFKPLSPKGEPDYDLAWINKNNFWVVEVKSLPDKAEVSQMRIGIGQVLHYKEQLRKRYPKLKVKTVLAIEKYPKNFNTWSSVCEDSNIILAYGPEFQVFRELFEKE